MQRLHIDGRLRGSVAATGTENIGSPALELRFPRCDLMGVNVELFRKLCQCSIALDGRKGHLRLTWGGSGLSGRNSTYRPVQILEAGSPLSPLMLLSDLGK